jgi:hypothetical protein
VRFALVSLFAGVANGTFVIFGTRSLCRQQKTAIRTWLCLMGNPRKVRQVVKGDSRKEVHMSDYRDPNDPMYGYEPADRTGIWGWIAGAAGVVIILVLGLALGVGHGPTRVASNNATPPQTTAPGTHPAMPGLTPPSQAPNR